MFALCRVRVQNSITFLQRRGNASLQGQGSLGNTLPNLAPSPPVPSVQSTTVTAKPPNVPPTTQGRRRRRKESIPPRRPEISATNPRKWNRPLAEGILPAYDLALKVIRTDSVRLRNEVTELQVRIAEKEAQVLALGGPRTEAAREDEEVLENMRERLRILQVQSEINLPEVRWRVANAMVDMKKPVHRYLMEQRWRKDGDLDLLMERLHQMKVVPDALPALHPSIDLHVTVRTPPKELQKTKKAQIAVEPGTFLFPEQTLAPPKLYANVFHTDTRLYTMLLVDLDVPNEDKATFSTFLHWLRPNVPLSALHRTRIPDLNSHTPYIPPYPQRGTPYHRYVLLLLPQPPAPGSSYTRNAEARAQPGVTASAHLDIPHVTDAQRKQFDIRAFVQQWGLDGAKGGGVHMWREVWSEAVSKIFANILREEEPRYGRPPKADPYAHLKGTKRYV